MKHVIVVVGAWLIIVGYSLGMNMWITAQNKERAAFINENYIGKCVDMEPFKSVKVIAHIVPDALLSDQQFQVVTTKDDGEEGLLFVPEETVLGLPSHGCTT